MKCWLSLVSLGRLSQCFLIALQLNATFPTEKAADGTYLAFFPGTAWPLYETIFGIVAAGLALLFGLYTRALGNKLLFFMALIMIPLATTEIGTDGWIESIMTPIAKMNEFDAGLVLVYTSVIMMVLRFFAGPIVHAISPIGLLIGSSVLAICGLYWLSFASGMVIFAAAALYAFGKTFFWPTMLGVAGEQTPKGGALTLNALGGIGMLGVGVLGFPFIGSLQDQNATSAVSTDAELAEMVPSVFDGGELSAVSSQTLFNVLPYQKIDDVELENAIAELPANEQEPVEERLMEVKEGSKQGALAQMCIFPIIMLIGYIGLGFYFKGRGGYKVQTIDDKH